MEKNNLEEKVNNIKTNSEANENTEESKNRLSIKEKIKKFGIVEIIVFILYIIFIAIVAACHEFSQDETQSWLIARDLNLIDIIKQMKYEGHSFLWYYLIMPFAKLGFSIESQKIIVCLFAIATVYLILKKSPFNRLTKILLTFSSGMVYYYSAFARPYCMIPFLLACIAVIYKEKENHQYLYAILVGLLAHTHLVMFPTVFMLIITFWGKQLILKRKEKTKEEKKKLYKSLLLVIAIVSVYVIIAIISYFSCKIVRTYEGLGELLGAFPNLLSYTFKSTMVQFYGELYVPWYYKMLLLLIVILCVIGVKDSLKQGLTFWGQFIFTILVHTIIWFVLPTRVFIVIYTLMFWVWTDKDEQQKKEKPKPNRWIETALILLIIISMPNTYRCVYQDITKIYTSGKETAEYIQENIPENSVFICTYADLQQILVGQLPKDKYKFYMPNAERFVTFSIWDEKWKKPITNQSILKAIVDLQEQGYEDLYILSTSKMLLYMNNGDEVQIEYMYSEDEDSLIDDIYVNDQAIFYIYKIKLEDIDNELLKEDVCRYEEMWEF